MNLILAVSAIPAYFIDSVAAGIHIMLHAVFIKEIQFVVDPLQSGHRIPIFVPVICAVRGFYPAALAKLHVGDGDMLRFLFLPVSVRVNRGDDDEDVFPLGASAVNYLMNTPLVSEYLKHGNDYIYSIFCLYTKDPAGTMTDKRLSRIREAYHNAYPEYASIYATYYIYYLYKFYMNCYEDYSFVRNVRMGFIHLGMIEFLHALYYDKKSTLPIDEFTHILSAYNKRAYFNYENLDEMYEVFIADFF